MKRSHATVLLALIAVFWGLNWPIMKIGLTDVPPWVFRALASTSGGIGLMLIARLNGYSMAIPRHQWRGLALCAFLNISLWNILALYGIELMNSGRAAIVAYTMPLWATLFGMFVLGESLTRRAGAGLFVGLAGMVALFSGDAAALDSGWIGPLLVLLAAASWGAGTAAIKYYRFTVPVTVLVSWQHLLGTIPVAIVALTWDIQHIEQVSLLPALCVAYNMTVTALFCYWAYFKVVSSLPVVTSTVGTMMVPVLGVFFNALIFDEAPAPYDYIALAAVAVAMYLVLYKPKDVAAAN